MFKPKKKQKRKKMWQDYKKKKNVLRRWKKEQANRKREGLPLKRMPVDFSKSKKYGYE